MPARASLALALGLLLVALGSDIATGPAGLPLQAVFAALSGAGEPTERFIVLQFRLPVALMAVVVGACLGLAGAAMQTVLDNPLASPFTMGLAAAAGVGASVVMLFGGNASGLMGIAAGAALGCLLAAGAIYGLGRAKGMGQAVMTLTGITLMFFFQSIQSLLQYRASQESLQRIVHWLFGDLQRATWPGVVLVAGALLLGLTYLMVNAWRLTALKLGDARAKALGVPVDALKQRALAVISLLTAAAVCLVGTIAFIGLVAPHLARGLVGEDHRLLLPMSAICGAVLLSFGSVLAKSIIPGVVLPISVVTALIGVPFLLFLVLRSERAGP
jgi:iron complex transport system permease protein